MADQGPSTLKFKSVLPGQGISEYWALVGRVWKGGNPRYDKRWGIASEMHGGGGVRDETTIVHGGQNEF